MTKSDAVQHFHRQEGRIGWVGLILLWLVWAIFIVIGDKAALHNPSPLTVVKETCKEIQLTGLAIPGTNLRNTKPLTWHDCRKTFSDGSWYRREGY